MSPARAPASMLMLHHGHARFHVERADRAAGVLDHVAGAATGADLGDHGQDDVLGRDQRRERAFDAHFHGLRLGLQQALRSEHVLHFTRADAEGE